MTGKYVIMMVSVKQTGLSVWDRFGKDNIVAAIVLDPHILARYKFFSNIRGDRIPLIGIRKYKEHYANYKILIATLDAHLAIRELEKEGVYYYQVAGESLKCEAIPHDPDISHENWGNYLKQLFDHEGVDILEVGSRNVTGSTYGKTFRYANYIGFDYYEGDNVDVIGDAHRLSSYFDKKFDLIFSSAVFEHLAMPWKVAIEIIKLLKLNGHIFIETHCSFASHERPWHFFQFSENALHALFPRKFGMICVKKGCSNLIEGRFSDLACEYLRGITVHDMYCHSEFLGKKVEEVERLSWDDIELQDAVGSTEYPKPVN